MSKMSANCFDQYRHYSNLRFLMIPIFLSAAGGLFLAYGLAWDSVVSLKMHTNTEPYRLPITLEVGRNVDDETILMAPFFGIITAAVFIFLECSLDKYITAYRRAAREAVAKELNDTDLNSYTALREALDQPIPNLGLVSISIKGMYFASALAWVYLWFFAA